MFYCLIGDRNANVARGGSNYENIDFTMISLSILLYGCCKDGINTTVKKNLTTNLDKYHTAKIIVQDDDYKTSRRGLQIPPQRK